MTGEAARSPPHEGEGSPEPGYPPKELLRLLGLKDERTLQETEYR